MTKVIGVRFRKAERCIISAPETMRSKMEIM